MLLKSPLVTYFKACSLTAYLFARSNRLAKVAQPVIFSTTIKF